MLTAHQIKNRADARTLIDAARTARGNHALHARMLRVAAWLRYTPPPDGAPATCVCGTAVSYDSGTGLLLSGGSAICTVLPNHTPRTSTGGRTPR